MAVQDEASKLHSMQSPTPRDRQQIQQEAKQTLGMTSETDAGQMRSWQKIKNTRKEVRKKCQALNRKI